MHAISDPLPAGAGPVPARRSGFRRIPEKAIELVIRLCGISAIVFVFGIFFFVFREGGSILWESDTEFSIWKFFTSSEWYPTSMSNKRYGIVALIAGTLSVTVLAMLIAVPFALGATVFVSEFCGGKLK
jgi:phosphate transport system permease protein